MPGQAISSASLRSAGVGAIAAPASATRASRSTTSSASAARQAPSSTPGGLHSTGTKSAATTRRTTAQPYPAPGAVSVVGQHHAGGGGDALQVASRALGLGIAGDQIPETGAVTGDDQVGQLVQEHVVDHPVGHLL